MFVPIILGSDKTTVSVATGQNDFYPLYFSIGNIQNHIRRAHKNRLVLIAFLPIPKGQCLLILYPPNGASTTDDRCQEGYRHRGVPKFQAGLDTSVGRDDSFLAAAFHDVPQRCAMP